MLTTLFNFECLNLRINIGLLSDSENTILPLDDSRFSLGLNPDVTNVIRDNNCHECDSVIWKIPNDKSGRSCHDWSHHAGRNISLLTLIIKTAA